MSVLKKLQMQLTSSCTWIPRISWLCWKSLMISFVLHAMILPILTGSYVPSLTNCRKVNCFSKDYQFNVCEWGHRPYCQGCRWLYYSQEINTTTSQWVYLKLFPLVRSLKQKKVTTPSLAQCTQRSRTHTQNFQCVINTITHIRLHLKKEVPHSLSELLNQNVHHSHKL